MSLNETKIPLPGEHQYELYQFAIGAFAATAYIIDDQGTVGINIFDEPIGSIGRLPSVPNVQLLPEWENHFEPMDVFILVNHITRAWKQRRVCLSRIGVLVLSNEVSGALDILHDGVEYQMIPDLYEDLASLTARYSGESRIGAGVIRRTGVLFTRYQLQCPSRQFPALRQRYFRKTLLKVARAHLETFATVRHKLYANTTNTDPAASDEKAANTTGTDAPNTDLSFTSVPVKNIPVMELPVMGPAARPTPKPSPSPRPGGVPAPRPNGVPTSSTTRVDVSWVRPVGGIPPQIPNVKPTRA